MRASQQMQGRAAQRQRISPRLVAAGAVLKMSSEELQLRLEEEAELNPALEIVWDQMCPTCGRGLSNGNCWFCSLGADNGKDRTAAYDAFPIAAPRFRNDGGDNVYDPLENAQAPLTLRDHVLLQARLVLSSKDLAIAEYLVAGLNEDGLLEGSLEEAAEALGAEQSRVLRVLSHLQSLDPPGVCARSVQESVLIQFRELAAEAPVADLVEPIISGHWRDLANHAYEKIGRALRASPEAIESAVAFIRENLHPYPGRLYRAPHQSSRQSRFGVLRPDVIIRQYLADYLVEVVRPFDFELKVSEAYRRLHLLPSNGDGNSGEHRLALEQYRRATWLLQSLALREQTLRQIAEYVAVFQRPFLDTEFEHKMKRLTRTQVAEHIGKHPSTVSRAVSGKFVLVPSGTLVPFEKFFSPAVAPKTVIAELLSNEDPERPLTDEQICRILRVRGFQIARRTVAKYRLALRLPSSPQRGRH